MHKEELNECLAVRNWVKVDSSQPKPLFQKKIQKTQIFSKP